MRRKRRKKEVDRNLLEAIIIAETEWKKMRNLVDNSFEALDESRHYLKLVEAKYMFLLREAKHRKINILRY